MLIRRLERWARRAGHGARMRARAMVLRVRRPWAGWRPMEPPRDVRRIVALRRDRLGDLVLTLPALEDLRRGFPGAEVHAWVPAGLVELLRHQAGLDAVDAVPRDEPAMAESLRRLDPQLVVDFSAPDETRIPRAAWRAGIAYRAGGAGGGREVYLTHWARPPAGGKRLSLPAYHTAILRSLGVDSTPRAPRWTPAPGETAAWDERLRRLGAGDFPRIAVHPGGTYPSQRWPMDRFVTVGCRLARRWGAPILVLGSDADATRVQALMEGLGPWARRVETKGVRDLALVLSQLDLLLTNNSGPLHLAAAVNTATISVMGPTDPVRFWPWGDHQKVLRRSDLPCSPCSRGRCAGHECLVGIPPVRMLQAAEAMLESLGRRRRMEVSA